MRLIDADTSIESIRNLLGNGHTLEQGIDAQPTAYDVGMIVEQIYKEQEREFINNEVAIGDMTCAKVIEIVKAGGVNE